MVHGREDGLNRDGAAPPPSEFLDEFCSGIPQCHPKEERTAGPNKQYSRAKKPSGNSTLSTEVHPQTQNGQETDMQTLYPEGKSNEGSKRKKTRRANTKVM